MKKWIFVTLAIVAAILSAGLNQLSSPSVSAAGQVLAPMESRYVDRVNFPADTPWWIIKWVSIEGVEIFQNWGPVTRRTTGVGLTTNFLSGERVAGFQIQLETGEKFTQCWVDTWANGTVLDGVINPWPGEIANLKPCR